MLERGEIEFANLPLIAVGEPGVKDGSLSTEFARLEDCLEITYAEGGALHGLEEGSDIAGGEGRLDGGPDFGECCLVADRHGNAFVEGRRAVYRVCVGLRHRFQEPALHAFEDMERETGIGPATNSLEGCDSTTELLPRRAIAPGLKPFVAVIVDSGLKATSPPG